MRQVVGKVTFIINPRDNSPSMGRNWRKKPIFSRKITGMFNLFKIYKYG